MFIDRIKKRLEAIMPIDQETGIAYISKLPVIKVAWEREDGAIVGFIETDDGKKFETYAKDPVQFIEMINDAVFTVYDIPHNYRHKFFHMYYKPEPEELTMLMEGKVLSSNFKAEKNYQPVFG